MTWTFEFLKYFRPFDHLFRAILGCCWVWEVGLRRVATLKGVILMNLWQISNQRNIFCRKGAIKLRKKGVFRVLIIFHLLKNIWHYLILKSKHLTLIRFLCITHFILFVHSSHIFISFLKLMIFILTLMILFLVLVMGGTWKIIMLFIILKNVLYLVSDVVEIIFHAWIGPLR